MNASDVSPSIHVVTKFKKKKSCTLNEIQSEYCLKRNNFDPHKPSPNMFINKLEIRMKVYYKNFCNVSNSNMK